MNTGTCRLCAGALQLKFTRRVLQKYDVSYLQCDQCASLQTEVPYWLEEAYSANNLSNFDTGAAQRNINALAACYAMCRFFGVRNLIDIGGGDGLLCRLLRDYEINCFVQDKYAAPTYAQGFTQQDFATPEMVVAFEVVEHFAEPQHEIEALFRSGPKVVLVSTGTFSDQGEKWWYLEPDSGQHVFFYSVKALRQIAERFGYELGKNGNFIVFVRDVSRSRMRLAEQLLGGGLSRLVKAWILTRPARGVSIDHTQQLEVARKRQ